MCYHQECRTIHNASRNGRCTGVAVIVLNKYYDQFPVILLGKERGGPYALKFNFAAGSIDPGDYNCILAAAMRELREEFKLDVRLETNFDQHFRYNGQIIYFMHHGTPVFVGMFRGLSRGLLNPVIAQCNANLRLDTCLREMECVNWFRLDQDLIGIDGVKYNISPFVEGVVRRNKQALISLCC